MSQLEQRLPKGPSSNARIERLTLAPADDSEAKALGGLCKATLVIWGTYDDYGITPHYEITKHEERVYETVHLEEVPNLPSQSQRYAIYISRGLPQAMTYLTLFTVGQIQYQTGQLEEALDTFDQALLTVTDDSPHELGRYHIYVWIGVIYYERGEEPQSIEAYTQAIDLNAECADAYYNRGLAHSHMGEYEQAIADYSEAIRLEPDYAWAYGNRAGVYADLGEYGRAMVDYAEAIRLEPSSASNYSNRGATWGELDHYEAARADYAEAIRIDPEYVVAYYGRGWAYNKKRQYEQAIADFTEAISLDPDYADA